MTCTPLSRGWCDGRANERAQSIAAATASRGRAAGWLMLADMRPQLLLLGWRGRARCVVPEQLSTGLSRREGEEEEEKGTARP